jgi:hypothetical protein
VKPLSCSDPWAPPATCDRNMTVAHDQNSPLTASSAVGIVSPQFFGRGAAWVLVRRLSV